VRKFFAMFALNSADRGRSVDPVMVNLLSSKKSFRKRRRLFD
jgi:hypothetical protein